jgi:hypothetical protein
MPATGSRLFELNLEPGVWSLAPDRGCLPFAWSLPFDVAQGTPSTVEGWRPEPGAYFA